MEIKKQTNLRGTLTVPGDKSISHRAVMFGSLAKGTTCISHFLEGADCLSTISCFRKMGISIERRKSEILVHGKGLHGLSSPEALLDVGNSGTTTRLISGILAGQKFISELDGDDSCLLYTSLQFSAGLRQYVFVTILKKISRAHLC